MTFRFNSCSAGISASAGIGGKSVFCAGCGNCNFDIIMIELIYAFRITISARATVIGISLGCAAGGNLNIDKIYVRDHVVGFFGIRISASAGVFGIFI